MISDINMGSISGLDLVPYVLQETPETVVVMVSGKRNIDTAIQAMRERGVIQGLRGRTRTGTRVDLDPPKRRTSNRSMLPGDDVTVN